MTQSTNNIQKTELWELASKLISFDTVSAHSNVEAAEYIANYAQDAGLDARVVMDEINGVQKASVLVWTGPAVEDGLILSGHMDTVPFEGQPGWQRDPLKMQLEGDYIYGRGVSDMKVFLAQALLAAKQQPRERFKRPLLFLLTYGEEVTGEGSDRLVQVLPQKFTELPLPKFAMIGEPTDFEIFPSHKGYATFDVLVHGKAGHSSVPSAGLNAIEKMGDVIRILRETDQELQRRTTAENRELFPECAYSAFNYGVIQGGMAPNMIAEKCSMTMSIRVTPDDNIQDILDGLRKRFDKELTPSMRTKGPECGVFLENVKLTPALKSPSKSPMSSLLSEIMERPVHKGAPYATDGGQFAALGIQSYICGPGALAQAHQPNERLAITNFLSGQERLARIIQQWCLADQQ